MQSATLGVVPTSDSPGRIALAYLLAHRWPFYVALFLVCAVEWAALAGARSPYATGNADYWVVTGGYRLHYDATGWVDLARYLAGDTGIETASLNRAGRPILAYLGAIGAPYAGAVPALLGANLVIWWLTSVYAFKWAALWLGRRLPAALAAVLVATSLGLRVLGGTPVPDALSMLGTVLFLYTMERLGLGVSRPRCVAGMGDETATRVRRWPAAAAGVLLGWVLLGKEAYYLVAFMALWGVWRRRTIVPAAIIAGVAGAIVAGWFAVIAVVLNLPAEPVASGEGGIVERLVLWGELIEDPFGGALARAVSASLVSYPLRYAWAFGWVPAVLALGGLATVSRRAAASCVVFTACLFAMLFVWRLETPPIRLLFLGFPFIYALAGQASVRLAEKTRHLAQASGLAPSTAWLVSGSVLALAMAACVAAGHLDVYAYIYYG